MNRAEREQNALDVSPESGAIASSLAPSLESKSPVTPSPETFLAALKARISAWRGDLAGW